MRPGLCWAWISEVACGWQLGQLARPSQGAGSQLRPVLRVCKANLRLRPQPLSAEASEILEILIRFTEGPERHQVLKLRGLYLPLRLSADVSTQRHVFCHTITEESLSEETWTRRRSKSMQRRFLAKGVHRQDFDARRYLLE